MTRAERAAGVRARAEELGFSMVGITLPTPSAHLPSYRAWLERGMHGEMDYLARADAVARRGDLSETLGDVRSVVVVGHEYYAEDDPAAVSDPSRGIIARYARGADYHRVVKRKLVSLARWLDEATGGGRRTRVYVDTGPILERELARRAGLGWFGRNTMLLHPRRGSYFFLGVLLTEVELAPDEPFPVDHCGSCRACLDACPTGALLGRDERGAPVMDARRCISYLTIEHRGPIPEELRPLMGNRVYGCDICQEVCPFNERFARPTAEPRYAARGPGRPPPGVEAEGPFARHRGTDAPPVAGTDAPSHPGTNAPPLVDLLRTALDEDRWEAFSRGSAIRRAGREGFARNVCVALGNGLAGVGDPPEDALGVLRSALRDTPLVREHAAWALERIGTLA